MATDRNGEDLDLTNIVTAVDVNGVKYAKCGSKQTAVWSRNLYYIEGNRLYISSRNEGDILTITDNNGTNHRYSYSNKTLTLIP